MKMFIKFLKGIALGIANIVPGFSGGTMAIMLNIYDDFVGMFADILKHPLQAIKKSGIIFVGLAVGVVIALFTIVNLLDIAPLPTTIFFVGIIIANVPVSFKKANFDHFKIRYLIIMAIMFGIVVTMPLLSENSLGDEALDIWFILLSALMGVISASAMVLPGLSGSMLLMAFGYYTYIIKTLKNAVVYLVGLDFALFGYTMIPIVAFLIGSVFGFVAVSKLVRVFYTKCPNAFNVAVVGLLAASPVAILIATNKEYSGVLFGSPWWMYLIGIATLVAGVVASYYAEKVQHNLVELEKKEEAKNEVSEVSE